MTCASDSRLTAYCVSHMLWTGLVTRGNLGLLCSLARSRTRTRLTCGFILQLGLLQALLTLYLNHLQVLTLLVWAGCPAALRTKQTEVLDSTTDVKSRGQAGPAKVEAALSLRT